VLTEIQTISNDYAVTTSTVLRKLSILTKDASSVVDRSVIVDLGTTLPVPLTYNAAGLPNSGMASILIDSPPSDTAGKIAHTETVSHVIIVPTASKNAALTTASTQPRPITTANVTTSTATTDGAIGNNGNGASNATSAPAQNSTISSNTQALINVTSNPAYASMAASLYVNMALMSSKKALYVGLPNDTGIVGPIAAVSPLRAASTSSS